MTETDHGRWISPRRHNLDGLKVEDVLMGGAATVKLAPKVGDLDQ